MIYESIERDVTVRLWVCANTMRWSALQTKERERTSAHVCTNELNLSAQLLEKKLHIVNIAYIDLFWSPIQ